MIKHNENGNTYICITPWCRLIFFEGKYQGWYNPRLNKVLEP